MTALDFYYWCFDNYGEGTVYETGGELQFIGETVWVVRDSFGGTEIIHLENGELPGDYPREF